MYQSALTVRSEIRAGQLDRLKALLESLNADPAGNGVAPFGKFANVHYARLVVLDPATDLDGSVTPPALMLHTDFDGPLEPHLRDLARIAGTGLDTIFSHAVDYPDPTQLTEDSRLTYLRAHMVKAGASYVNTIGRTVEQILGEAKLREAIQSFLDSRAASWRGQDALAVRAAIREFVRVEMPWALHPPAPEPLAWRIGELLHFLAVVLGGIVLLPLILAAAPFFWAAVRFHELRDVPSTAKPTDQSIQTLRMLEDGLVINPFAAIGFLKPGLFRRFVASLALFGIRFGVRHIFNRADLGGVKTIHFARWVYTDNHRRIIFCSNYDGSLESYMNDFIDKLWWGLNLIFSNGYGFPRTRWLILDGSRDELTFKNYLRTHQIANQFWYTAYPDLTALNIENNARIRLGLSGDMDAGRARQWLLRF